MQMHCIPEQDVRPICALRAAVLEVQHGRVGSARSRAPPTSSPRPSAAEPARPRTVTRIGPSSGTYRDLGRLGRCLPIRPYTPRNTILRRGTVGPSAIGHRMDQTKRKRGATLPSCSVQVRLIAAISSRNSVPAMEVRCDQPSFSSCSPPLCLPPVPVPSAFAGTPADASVAPTLTASPQQRLDRDRGHSGGPGVC